MTANQRRRRLVFWRGSFPVLFVFTIVFLATALADRIAPL
jgi:hypothetical protein